MLKKSFVILFVIINIISLTYSFNQIQNPSNNSIITNLNQNISTTILGTENTSTFINWDNSLVGYWNFELNTNDLSPNNNHGTQTGGTTIQNTNKIRGNNSYFDGSNDYINIGSGNNLDILGNMSVSFWFNTDSFPAEGYTDVILARGIGGESSDTNFQYVYGIKASGGNTYLAIDHESGPGVNNVHFSNNSLQINIWYHAVIIRDSELKNYYFYKDGIFESNQTYLTNPTDGSSGTVAIGRPGGYSANYFRGKMDEVMIFNRTISENEIKALYNSQVHNLQFETNTLQNNTQYTYDIFTINTSGHMLKETYNFYTNTSYVIPIQNTNNNVKKLPSLSFTSLIISIILLLGFLI